MHFKYNNLDFLYALGLGLLEFRHIIIGCFKCVSLGLHCKKRHFVSNRCIYLNQSNVESTQDIYLLQSEFVIAKQNFLSCQIVVITLNGIICFKKIYLFGTKWCFLQCTNPKIVRDD